MKIFVSSPRVGQSDSAAVALIARLRAAGAAVEDSPPDRASVPAGDARLDAWDGWYAGGCARAVASADVFVAVVDDWFTSSTWMGIETTAATEAATGRASPRLAWYEDVPRGGAAHLLSWWAAALGARLPDGLEGAVAAILAWGGDGTSAPFADGRDR